MTIQRVGVQNAMGFFTFVVGDATNTVQAVLHGYFVTSYSGRIRACTLAALQSGSIQFDLWRSSFSDAPPDVLDSICGASKPALVGEQKKRITNLTDWDVEFDAGDWFAVVVDSATGITRCTLTLDVAR